MTGTITLNNEFTVQQLSEVGESLKTAINANDEVIVEMAGVETIDVAALQTLIAAKKECERIGHKLILRGSSAVAKILSRTGLQL
jgi:anti-anti-sigma factor